MRGVSNIWFYLVNVENSDRQRISLGIEILSDLIIQIGLNNLSFPNPPCHCIGMYRGELSCLVAGHLADQRCSKGKMGLGMV